MPNRIARTLAELSGGSLQFAPNEPTGLRVTLYLPAPPAPPPTPVVVSSTRLGGSGAKVAPALMVPTCVTKPTTSTITFTGVPEAPL